MYNDECYVYVYCTTIGVYTNTEFMYFSNLTNFNEVTDFVEVKVLSCK